MQRAGACSNALLITNFFSTNSFLITNFFSTNSFLMSSLRTRSALLAMGMGRIGDKSNACGVSNLAVLAMGMSRIMVRSSQERCR